MEITIWKSETKPMNFVRVITCSGDRYIKNAISRVNNISNEKLYNRSTIYRFSIGSNPKSRKYRLYTLLRKLNFRPANPIMAGAVSYFNPKNLVRLNIGKRFLEICN